MKRKTEHDGTWKNGNWYGSSFRFDGEVDDDYTMQILMRGMSWSGTSSCHVWNIFLDNEYEPSVMSFTASTPTLSLRPRLAEEEMPGGGGAEVAL